jgi:ribosomal protein S25
MAAAMAGAKAKKKKWNKGKMHEKMNAKILFDDESWQRLENEVPKVSSHFVQFHVSSWL